MRTTKWTSGTRLLWRTTNSVCVRRLRACWIFTNMKPRATRVMCVGIHEHYYYEMIAMKEMLFEQANAYIAIHQSLMIFALTQLALIIDGATLAYALHDDIKLQFLELAKQSKVGVFAIV